jgi:hypothetical protein
MSPEPKPTLPPKQLRAIESLLAGRTKIEAAAQAGVSYRTLHRWLQDPTFRAALTTASDATFADATHRLTGVLDEAVTVLAKVMNNEQAKEADRLRAASLIISRSLDLIQQKQILDRVTALEAVMIHDELTHRNPLP